MRESSAAPELRPLTVEGAAGTLFAILRAPAEGPRHGGVLYLPPFAEELNMSRRMAALAADALARAGFAVLTLDPFGTGDSGGDFADATWAVWRADAAAGLDRLRAETAGRPAAVWGLRLGAALAMALARDRPDRIARALLWQPVTSGRQMLTQFLRIRVAAGLGGEAVKETTGALRALLAAGETVEVAGYALSPRLADDLEGLALAALAPPPGVAVDWLEVGAEVGAPPAPASARVIEAWRGEGAAVRAETVAGEAFWSIQETTLAPDLIAASLRALAPARAAA